MAAIPLTRTHRILIGIVVAGAVIIAAIGFAGSYAAVRELAEAKGFGQFSLVFPIGIDAGICVLLALDLLLTWMRIPFPLLRQTAWLLTAATIAFNGAASWPDPLGTAMHAVIPVLFVVSVEAARHAVGRIADITADKHMEGVRLTRWLLSPVPTFKLWRRMKLWELRSYEQVIKLEQERLIYQARLQARFGRNWRRKAPVESMMPLRLAKYGVPLAETAPAGLAAAGIEPALLPPAPKAELPERPELSYDPQQEQEQQGQIQGQGQGQGQVQAQPQPQPQAQPQDQQHQQHQQHQQPMSLQKQAPQQQHHPVEQPAPQAPGSPQIPVAPEAPQVPPTHDSPWFAAQKLPEGPHSSAYDPEYTEGLEPTPAAVPLGPGRTRPLGDVGTIGAVPHPRQEERPQVRAQAPEAAARVPEPDPEEAPQLEEWPQEDAEYADLAFEVFTSYTDQEGQYPSVEILDIHLADTRNVRHPRSTELLQRLMPEFRKAYVPAQATADQSA
ncbi:DUF2637 domain-containing protein [Streptomyces sp. KAI-26]|uniref:DUF2637 domain-containing protein n=1 Tax=Streptomyces sp. KAI-26 TaxID=1169747 RepID=UPI0015870441|nr:DUF2637 domain-containing protein [Streptomyces sp. KAI-26]NUV87634.1 DUF2637 domain-containing protein [Streptomyces sp. KAI-26]NUW20434.1 DUF2637 domain-containing protein [Streptomyces roseoviolaceus]